QAEDGIRDRNVTGAQTCALPIYGTDIGEQTLADTNTTFFALLAEIPLAGVTSILAILLVIMFFVSGADSNTFVLSVLSSRGSMKIGRAACRGQEIVLVVRVEENK